MRNDWLDYLYHYGTPRHSGRYPWGSGKNPYHHSKTRGLFKDTFKSNKNLEKEKKKLETALKVARSDIRNDRKVLADASKRKDELSKVSNWTREHYVSKRTVKSNDPETKRTILKFKHPKMGTVETDFNHSSRVTNKDIDKGVEALNKWLEFDRQEAEVDVNTWKEAVKRNKQKETQYKERIKEIDNIITKRKRDQGFLWLQLQRGFM